MSTYVSYFFVILKKIILWLSVIDLVTQHGQGPYVRENMNRSNN